MSMYLDLFPAAEAPLGIMYSDAGTDIVWLPRCQGFVRVTGGGPNLDVGVSVSELASQHHRFN